MTCTQSNISGSLYLFLLLLLRAFWELIVCSTRTPQISAEGARLRQLFTRTSVADLMVIVPFVDLGQKELLTPSTSCTKVFKVDTTAGPLAAKVIVLGDNIDKLYAAVELKLLALLKHPHLLKLTTAYLNKGAQPPQLWLMTEYCELGSLAKWEPGGTRVSLPARIFYGLLRQTLSALDYLHSINAAHLDVKPDNVLIRRQGGACLADLGLAQPPSESPCHTNVPIGTPLFSAAEVLALDVAEEDAASATSKPMMMGKSLGGFNGQLADMWSFGMTVYVFLVPRPYPGCFDSRDMLSFLQLHNGPSKMKEIMDSVSFELRDVLARCLAMEASSRSSSSVLIRCPLFTTSAASDEQVDEHLRDIQIDN